jgi:hypothetical protein
VTPVRAALVAVVVLFAGTAAAQPVLPPADAPFAGTAERTLAGSKPEYPQATKAPAGAPNILVVLVDDAGFGNPSTFGGPVRTPTLDHLAEQGLRYNRFHVTALCSPTRAAMLSGRNHHAVGFGSIAETHGGFPGYDALWPRSAASVARILRDNGYSTAAIGKWHLTPDDEQGPVGPFDRWPNALGFDYFWGFLGGESSHYDPLLVENDKVVGVPTEKHFYLTTAMADRAIAWLRAQRSQSPDRPFFIYFATGASHAPHHVPPEWSKKYQGKFDQGWDKLREETFARQKKLGVIPADAKADAAPRHPPRVGLPRRRRAHALRAPDGGLRRFPGGDGPRDRARDRGDRRPRPPRRHARRLRVRRQRREHGGDGDRHVQRDHGAERHRADAGAAGEGDQGVRRPRGVGRAAHAPALLGGLGVGRATRRSSGGSRSPRTSAGRATRWSSRGRSASGTRAASGASSRTRST